MLVGRRHPEQRLFVTTGDGEAENLATGVTGIAIYAHGVEAWLRVCLEIEMVVHAIVV
jgi:hypothetical protein